MKNATTTTQIEDYTVNYKLTTLERCLMIWCNASLPGDAISVNLGKDWAVATPANQHIPCVSTNVLRWSNLNDMAASISRRLATKYKVQVYVSLDLTSSLIPSSQNRDPNSDVVMLELEKRLVQFMGGVL